jgi:putative component of toxin-antitoxin plasmid stabilization module
MSISAILNGTSVLDPANPANYKPVKGDWEIRVKHGRGWRVLLNERAMSDLAAARRVHRDTGYRTVKVRAAEMNDRWRIFKFPRHRIGISTRK